MVSLQRVGGRGIECDCSYLWAAEWLGKLSSIRLAERLGVQKRNMRRSIADNVGACLGPSGGKHSRCAWIDQVRLAFASSTSRGVLVEGYTPAEHDTKWSHAVAQWQSVCHQLTAKSAANAQPMTFPFGDTLDVCALFFRGSRLVADIRHSLDAIYNQVTSPPCSLLQTVVDDRAALSSWDSAVHSGLNTTGGMRFAYWTRSAPATHTSTSPAFKCPLSKDCCRSGTSPGILSPPLSCVFLHYFRLFLPPSLPSSHFFRPLFFLLFPPSPFSLCIQRGCEHQIMLSLSQPLTVPIHLLS
jgi:hypothetical protein